MSAIRHKHLDIKVCDLEYDFSNWFHIVISLKYPYVSWGYDQNG